MSDIKSAYCATHYDTKNDCRACSPSVREACWKPIPSPLTLEGIRSHANAVDKAILALGES